MRHEALALYPLRAAADVPLVTTDQMREVDRLAIDDAQLSLLQMMENAGRALATITADHLPPPMASSDEPPSALVVAGRGNNGGGALVAARNLRNWGFDVEIVLSSPPGSLGEAAAQQHHVLHKDGVRSLWPGAPDFDERFPESLDQALVVVDGLIGYGINGPLRGDTAVLVEAILDRAPPTVVSLDVPTGFNATSGDVYNFGIVASVTVTLALPKSGLYRRDAAAAVGEMFLADIGIPNYIYDRVGVEGVAGLFTEGPLIRLLDSQTG
ncbi:MAG TPA: NAD(P)H-hydrate epimerase [Dehalococcoidia bacterium]|nr:NAD(P)H-hydrate epimerase [Dehalococcoidia bacterium]